MVSSKPKNAIQAIPLTAAAVTVELKWRGTPRKRGTGLKWRPRYWRREKIVNCVSSLGESCPFFPSTIFTLPAFHYRIFRAAAAARNAANNRPNGLFT